MKFIISFSCIFLSIITIAQEKDDYDHILKIQKNTWELRRILLEQSKTEAGIQKNLDQILKHCETSWAIISNIHSLEKAKEEIKKAQVLLSETETSLSNSLSRTEEDFSKYINDQKKDVLDAHLETNKLKSKL